MAVGVKRVLLSWSSGKDCAWALHLLRQREDVEVVALVTSFNEAFERVAMHAVRRELVEAQARAVELPLWEAKLPWPCTNERYEAVMAEVWERARGEGIECVAFGDLFLEEIRAYRLKQLEGTGLEALFPVWGIPTGELAATMFAAGVKAVVTCVDPKRLGKEFVGREFDEAFVKGLPVGVDACGENGEFHTFCTAGPEMGVGVKVRVGDVVERDGFWFADLLGG